jgi:2,4-diketo-3-deoxy-L-fuconate hydrolase
MKTLLVTLAVLAGLALGLSFAVSRPQFAERLEPARLETVLIAPVQDALTFARYRAADGSLHLLLVTQFAAGRVTGYDLALQEPAAEPDPIKLFKSFGYDTLAQLVAVGAQTVTVDAAALTLPFDGREQNIGVGANYREHARESQISEVPFLFPKLAQPTPHGSDVARAGSVLLDYEAELGLVLLDDVPTGSAMPAHAGLVLANELTDRWALVRNMQPGSAMGTTGFADGKSREGFAPIGPLLVIPRDLDTFYPRIELRLWLDGRLRQRDRAANMTWRPSEILRQVFVRAQTPFHYRGGTISLLPQPTGIPAGTILFSGTPAGVIFKPLNLWNPWVYLRPGEEVVVSADFLGTIRNRIQ